MDKKELEGFFSRALTALIEHNGGSMEQALDDMKITNIYDRKSIKGFYGWDEDDLEDEDYTDDADLPDEIELHRPSNVETDKEFEDYIHACLVSDYGRDAESFGYEFNMTTIYVTNIKWLEEE